MNLARFALVVSLFALALSVATLLSGCKYDEGTSGGAGGPPPGAIKPGGSGCWDNPDGSRTCRINDYGMGPPIKHR